MRLSVLFTAVSVILVNPPQAGTQDVSIQGPPAWRLELQQILGEASQLFALGSEGIADNFDPLQVLIARAQAAAGDNPGALATASRISPSQQPEAFAEIAIGQARAGDFGAALQTAGAIDRKFEKGYALEEIALAQAKAGHVTGAVQTVMGIASHVWQARVLRDIAVSFAEAGDTPRARQVATGIPISWMRDEALRAIPSVQRRSRNPRVQEIVRKTANPLRDAAVAQAEAGDVAGGVRTAEGIASTTWKECTLVTIAEVQAKLGDVQGALQTAARISDAPAQGAPPARLAAWHRIAIARAEAGDVASALLIAAPLQGFMQSQAWHGIARAQAKAGDVKGALDLAAKSPSPRIKARTLLGIAEGILEANGIDVREKLGPCWPPVVLPHSQ